MQSIQLPTILFFLLFSNDFLIEMAVVEYDFIIRSIPSNPDGYPRRVIIMHHANSSWNIDRPFPCPLIRAKLGDHLRVHITNLLRDQATAIHFHGFHMLNNPWADGTVHITQCAIEPYEKYTYEFNITQTGTFWYHSHNAQQYADGLIGPIIIDDDPIQQKYDYDSNDYVIMLEEWYHENWPTIMTAYEGPFGAYSGNIPKYPWPPTSFLINGHGQFDCHTTDCTENTTWKDVCGNHYPAQCIPLRQPFFGPCKTNAHPLDEFLCPYGQQIRIRLINAASGIPFRFWIDQHNLTIVARDSIEIIPVTVPHVQIPIGQRLDIIVNCNQNSNMNYTIFIASRNSYQPPHNITGATPSMLGRALLVYSNSTNNQTTNISSIEVPKPAKADDLFFEYRYLKPLKPRSATPAIRRVVLSFEVLWNNRTGIDALEEWAINSITFEPPKEPLLHANYFDGTYKYSLANERIGRVNNTHATHIQYFEYGQTYEILMINYDPQLHPWHLHGYTVDFITAGKIPGLIATPCRQRRRRRRRDVNEFNFDDILPPLNSTPPVMSVGDSFNIPRESYVVFRFTANNPGPWFLHCHMEWHIWPGMALVFSIEQNGSYRQLIQPPSNSITICGTRKHISQKFFPSLISSSSIQIQSVTYMLLFFLINIVLRN